MGTHEGRNVPAGEGVPTWLQPSLFRWLGPILNAEAGTGRGPYFDEPSADFVLLVQRQLRLDLDWKDEARGAIQDLGNKMAANQDLFLDVLRLAIEHIDLAYDVQNQDRALADLEKILKDANSVWRVKVDYVPTGKSDRSFRIERSLVRRDGRPPSQASATTAGNDELEGRPLESSGVQQDHGNGTQCGNVRTEAEDRNQSSEDGRSRANDVGVERSKSRSGWIRRAWSGFVAGGGPTQVIAQVVGGLLVVMMVAIFGAVIGILPNPFGTGNPSHRSDAGHRKSSVVPSTTLTGTTAGATPTVVPTPQKQHAVPTPETATIGAGESADFFAGSVRVSVDTFDLSGKGDTVSFTVNWPDGQTEFFGKRINGFKVFYPHKGRRKYELSLTSVSLSGSLADFEARRLP